VPEARAGRGLERGGGALLKGGGASLKGEKRGRTKGGGGGYELSEGMKAAADKMKKLNAYRRFSGVLK